MYGGGGGGRQPRTEVSPRASERAEPSEVSILNDLFSPLRSVPSPAMPTRASHASIEAHLICVSLVFIACCCFGVLLVYLQPVLKPLIFALFLAYLLSPAVEFLTTPFSPSQIFARLTGAKAERRDLDEEEALVVGPFRSRRTRAPNDAGLIACPHSLAVFFVLFLTSIVIFMLVNLVISSIASLQEKFPKYKEQAITLIHYARSTLGRDTPLSKFLRSAHISLSLPGAASPVELSRVPAAWLSKWIQEVPITSYLMSIASAVLASMQTVAIVLLFAVFLMLGWGRGEHGAHGPGVGGGGGGGGLAYERERRAARARAESDADEEARAERMPLAEKIDHQVRRYIVLKSGLSALTAVSVGVTLGLLDVDLSFLFGLFSFFANFIPNVGAVVATLLPLPVVCLDPTMTWWGGLLAILLPLAIHMVIGNVIEPKVFGMGLALHPVVVLFTILLWALAWGISGMIVSVPLTAVLRIVLKEIRHPYSAVVVDLLEGRWLPQRGAGVPLSSQPRGRPPDGPVTPTPHHI